MSSDPRDGCAGGLLLVVSAPSGTGKTTVVERLAQIVPGLSLSRSYTSRPARAGEADGVDYNFITRARFESMIAADEFLEWADVFGNFYGTAAADTRRERDLGRDLVLVIDVQGARQVRTRCPDTVGVFVQSSTGVSLVYFADTSCAPSIAASNVSATTTAIGWPLYMTSGLCSTVGMRIP